jgi:hypothetical protein
MSDASVIKEFLISLGFKVDKSSQKDFDKGVKGVTATTIALGIEVAKAAEAVAKAVVKMATDLDQLYFASRRVNSAAENVKAFGFAMEQLGGTAQGAQSALEGIASFMRSNPGGERFIQGMGVATRDTNGQLRDTEAIAEGLGKKFAAMPFYMAKVRAQLLGIDERTLLALIQGPGPEADKHRAFAAQLGLGMDGGTEASNRFMEKMRDLRAEFDLLMVAGATRLLPMLQSFADWLSQIGTDVEAFKQSDLGREFAKAGVALGPLIDAFIRLATIIVKWVGPSLRSIVGSELKMLIDGMHAITGVLNIIIDILTGRWTKAWHDAASIAKAAVDIIVSGIGGLLHALHLLWDGGDLQKPNAPPAPTAGTLGAPGSSQGALGPSDGTGRALGMRDHIQAYLERSGVNRDVSRGVVAGISAEGGLNPNAVNPSSGAFGIGQWLGPRKAKLFARYGSHPSIDQQLDFLLSELAGGDRGGQPVLKSRSALEAMVNYLSKFMRPGIGLGGDLARGAWALQSSPNSGGGATIHQKTDIHVNGSKDPHSTAALVTTGQDRVNGNLVRNLKTAVA